MPVRILWSCKTSRLVRGEKHACAEILWIPVRHTDKRKKSFMLLITKEQGPRALWSSWDGHTHQILCCYGLPTFVTGHYHPSQPVLHVRKAVRQGQHSHDLARHCDVKLRLRGQKQRYGRLEGQGAEFQHLQLLQVWGFPSMGCAPRHTFSECLEHVHSWPWLSLGRPTLLPLAVLSRTRPGEAPLIPAQGTLWFAL